VLIAAQIFASLAALLHIVFFVFESVLWTRPAVFGRFGISSQDEADTIRPMAYNQGFYNLALAIGVAIGVILLGMGGDPAIVGKTLVIFGTGCMALAGVILLTTGRNHLSAAAIQFLPAAIALVLTAFSTVG
jgi:putative membrane protein